MWPKDKAFPTGECRDMGDPVATCSVRITDHPTSGNGIAVSLTDEGEEVVVTIDGAQLDDDPRGVVAELFNHLNLCAEAYSLKVTSAA